MIDYRDDVLTAHDILGKNFPDINFQVIDLHVTLLRIEYSADVNQWRITAEKNKTVHLSHPRDSKT